jgi:hypothetical protein
MINPNLFILSLLPTLADNGLPVGATAPDRSLQCEGFDYYVPTHPTGDIYVTARELNAQGGPYKFSVQDGELVGEPRSIVTEIRSLGPTRAELDKMLADPGPDSPPIGRTLARRLNRGRRS